VAHAGSVTQTVCKVVGLDYNTFSVSARYVFDFIHLLVMVRTKVHIQAILH
jgi:hypothetical protein